MKKKQERQNLKPANKEVGELKSQLARALADYDNLRKRTDEEKLTWVKFATHKFIGDLLPILDAFEASLNHTKDQGLAIAVTQLKDLLKGEGLTEIRPKIGDKFDEDLHEAVEIVPGKDDGTIAEVILSGWKSDNGPVVRHAKVKVYGTR